MSAIALVALATFRLGRGIALLVLGMTATDIIGLAETTLIVPSHIPFVCACID